MNSSQAMLLVDRPPIQQLCEHYTTIRNGRVPDEVEVRVVRMKLKRMSIEEQLGYLLETHIPVESRREPFLNQSAHHQGATRSVLGTLARVIRLLKARYAMDESLNPVLSKRWDRLATISDRILSSEAPVESALRRRLDFVEARMREAYAKDNGQVQDHYLIREIQRKKAESEYSQIQKDTESKARRRHQARRDANAAAIAQKASLRNEHHKEGMVSVQRSLPGPVVRQRKEAPTLGERVVDRYLETTRQRKGEFAYILDMASRVTNSRVRR